MAAAAAEAGAPPVTAALPGGAAAAPAAAPPAGVAGLAPVQRTGYQGFGSFHSGNVEDMIADPSWQPPPNPCAHAADAPAARTPFGAAWRPHFLIDFGAWTFLNHGAFGGALACAQREAEAWRARCEAQPLAFLDRELFPQLVRVMRELAGVLRCAPQELALLPNATTGLNTVCQSLRGRVGPGDALFSLDIGYGSVKKMLQVVAQQTGAQHVELAVQWPVCSPSELLSQVAAALPPNTRFAVFDAVTSNTAIALPIAELVALCHDRGVDVLIDGAHALGQLPVDLEALGADYFVGNCHKWLCAPRGSAFLHVPRRHQRHVHPLVVSHGHGSGFVSEFIWDGCRDYAPLLGISCALHAWQAVGWAEVRRYQRALLADATGMLCGAWSTGTLVPLSMCAAMALVELPAGCLAAARGAAGAADASSAAGPAASGAAAAHGPAPCPTATSADAKYLQDGLHFQHAIECPVKCIAGRLYVRISAHVYNELPDYQHLAAAVCAIGGLEHRLQQEGQQQEGRG